MTREVKSLWPPLALLALLAAAAAGLASCAPALPGEARIAAAEPAALASMRSELAAALKEDPDDARAHLLMARLLLREGKPDAAEPHAGEAARRLPFDGQVMNVMGEIYLAQDKRFRALTTFTQAIEFEPGLLAAYLNLAETRRLLGRKEEAVAALRAAIIRAPGHYPARSRLARILLETGRLAAAAEAAAAARRLRPAAEEARLLEIRIKKAQGRLTVAGLLAEEALREGPRSLALERELVDIHYQRQEWPAALALLARMERGGVLAPEDALRKVDILRAHGRASQASAALEALLRRHPGHPGALVARARGLLGNDDAAGALAALERALQRDPQSVEAHYWRAIAYYRMDRSTRGDEALAAAARLAPAHPRVRLLRVRRLLAARKLAEAEALLGQYLEGHPADGDALLVRSELLTLQGDYGAAERNLREIVPGSSGGALRFARARLAYLRGAFDAVVKETRPLATSPGAPWQVLYLHCAALLRLGRSGEALPLLRPRLGSGEGGGNLHRLMGDLQVLSGNRTKALRTWLAGLARFPRQHRLLEGLSRLAIEDGKWQQARDWLKAGIERPGPQLPLFLERLNLVYRKLGQPRQAERYLRRYLAETDPLLREREGGDEHGILFNTAYPAMGYGVSSSASGGSSPRPPSPSR